MTAQIRIQRNGAGDPCRQTEDDWNPRKNLLVRLNHELQRGWTNRDDYVRPAVFVLGDVKLAESLLIHWIGEQNGLHVLAIEFQFVMRRLERGSQALLDQIDARVRSAYFIQDEDPLGLNLCFRDTPNHAAT